MLVLKMIMPRGIFCSSRMVMNLQAKGQLLRRLQLHLRVPPAPRDEDSLSHRLDSH